MKKATLKNLVSYFAQQNFLPSDVADAVDEMKAELTKGEAKAQANRDLYASAHDAVMNAITNEPQTIAEIYEACKDELPEGFSKSKVQYAILNYWNAEVSKVENAKGANQYRKA